MAVIDGLLNAITDKAGVIGAAFGGGIVRIGVFGVGIASPTAVVFSVICGTITAVYLGPIGPWYLGWPASGPATLATTFLTGAFFMEIMKKLAERIAKWSPTIKGTENA